MGRDRGDQKVIDTIRRLVTLFQGVTVEFVHYRPTGTATIMVRTNDQKSLASLARCAQNANMAFLVWTDSPGRVQFELRAGDDPPGAEIRSVENLCERMAWCLIESGHIAHDEADRIIAAAWARPDSLVNKPNVNIPLQKLPESVVGDTESPGVLQRLINWIRRRPALAALVLVTWLTVTFYFGLATFYGLKVNKLESEIKELRKEIDQLRKGRNGR